MVTLINNLGTIVESSWFVGYKRSWVSGVTITHSIIHVPMNIIKQSIVRNRNTRGLINHKIGHRVRQCL